MKELNNRESKTRPVLATNGYAASKGAELFPLSTTTPASPTGATGTSELSAEQQWGGKSTWKIVNTTNNGNIAVTRNLTSPYPAQFTAPYIFIPVYIPDYTSLRDLKIILSMGDTSFANAFSFTWYVGPSAHTDKMRDGWHLLYISPAQYVVEAGAPSWSATINSIMFRFIKDTTGGNQGVAYIGTPIVGVHGIPQVIVYADDVSIDFYNYALPIFDAYGIKVNLACAAAWAAGNQAYMQLEHYLDARNRGHEICVHSINQIGVSPGALTYDLAIQDIAFNQRYVRDVIGSPGYTHFVFANGRYWVSSRKDLSVLDYMRDSLGIGLARTTDAWERNTTRTSMGLQNESSKYNLLTMPMLAPNSTHTTAELYKSAIDTAIERKSVGTIVFHGISPNGSSAITLPSTVDTVCAYLAEKIMARKLECPIGSQFLDNLSPYST